MSSPWVFVVNPVAGKGKGSELWEGLQPRLQQSNIRFEFIRSDYHTHVLSLVAEEYKVGKRRFVGIGGDGTLNEIINALFVASGGQPDQETLVGLIPVGTGNDWIKSQPRILKTQNVNSILQAEEADYYDVGAIQINGEDQRHYFINVAGAGLDGQVVRSIEQESSHKKRSGLSYLSGLIKGLFAYQAAEVEVYQDNVTVFSGKPLVITAAKGRYFGGGMQISPKAHYNSGMLECAVIKKVSIWRVIRQIPKLFNGKIDEVRFVEQASVRQLRIQGSSPLAVQADGEFMGEASEVVMEIIPKAIRMLR